MISPVLKRLFDFLAFLRYAFRRWGEDRCPQIAGSLAFTTLLALVPSFAIVVTLLSKAPFFDQVMAQIHEFLRLNLVPEIAERIINVYMAEFAVNAGRLTTRPWPSVSRPASRTWSRMWKTSGWAFSTSSKRTTA